MKQILYYDNSNHERMQPNLARLRFLGYKNFMQYLGIQTIQFK